MNISTSQTNIAHSSPKLKSPLSAAISGVSGGSQPHLISSSLPQTGLLNFASRSTLFSASAAGSTPGSLHGSMIFPATVNSKQQKTELAVETTAEGDEIWNEISQIRVLPLFNGEGFRGAIEDINDLVRYKVSHSKFMNAILLNMNYWI